jgi:hypothetical protein
LGIGVEPVSIADGGNLDAGGAELTVNHELKIISKICAAIR